MDLLPFSTTFVLASIVITLAPGPDILYVLAKGISQGKKPAIVAAAGFCSGLSIHTTAAVCGLSAMLLASATAFTVVKLLGAAYLVYLGVRALFSRGMISTQSKSQELPPRRIFAEAFAMNVLNPKVAVFFLAFLPQFVRPEKGQVPIQLLLLGIGFAVVAFTIFSLVGVFSSHIGLWIRLRPRVARGLDWLAGSAFIFLGLRLAVSSRP